MPINEIHLNDIDTVFEAEIRDNTDAVVDISTSLNFIKNFLFCKPDTTVIIRTGIFTTNGTDGLLRYTTVTGDLDAVGIWNYQIDIEISGGHWHSDVTTFNVEPNLNRSIDDATSIQTRDATSSGDCIRLVVRYRRSGA